MKLNLIDYQEIENNYQGNEDILADIANRLIEQIDNDIAEINQCYQNDNLEALAILSHRLKGACSNFFAPEIVRILYQIEFLAKRKISEGIEAYLVELAPAVKLFKADLSQLSGLKAA